MDIVVWLRSLGLGRYEAAWRCVSTEPNGGIAKQEESRKYGNQIRGHLGNVGSNARLIMRTIDYINAHKILVPPLVLGMMWYFNNWSTEAFLYLSLHGTYSMLWLIKQRLYPDRRFEQMLPLWSGILFVFLPLAGYYIAPYLLISRHVILPPVVVGLATSIFTFGIFLHYVSDAQKFYTLRLKKGLMEDGLFARTRNPN